MTITERVKACDENRYPQMVAKLASGYLIMADRQAVDGYCILINNPVVKSVNELAETQRQQFFSDMAAVGDALLAVTGARRINYEIWGNLDPTLHAHIVPRYEHEPMPQKTLPLCRAYDFEEAPAFDLREHGQIMSQLREKLRR